MTRSLPWILAGLLLAQAATVHAQPAGAQGEDFIYMIRSGDTLIGVAGNYTGNPSNWARLQTLNQVTDARALPIALPLRIPFSMIPEQAAPVRVSHIQGQAELNGGPASVGLAVPEGATLSAAPGSFMTLELADGSAIMVPGGSTVRLERAQAFVHGELTDTVLHISDGEVESRVAPQGQGVGRFEIRTPVAVTGVRGTRFRTQASSQGASSEVIEGSVRLRPGAAGDTVTVATGYGAVVGADGGLQGVRRLLPAPELGDPVRAGGGTWTVPFAPIPGAARYQVRVSTDAEGTRPVSSQEVQAPEDVRFSATGTGTFYASVQGIDEAGLVGLPAARPFDGVRALLSSSGIAVETGTGGLVTLTEY